LITCTFVIGTVQPGCSDLPPMPGACSATHSSL